MATSLTELSQETDLIGTLTSVINSTDGSGATFTATFVDKKTGQARAPQTTTLEYTIDQDNSLSETILLSNVSTTGGITTGTFANNGRSIPKFGAGAGSNTGNTHQIGANIGCVDIARPLNIIQQALNEKINTTGGTFTGPVNFSGATATFQIPNLTQAQINALTPQEGMIVKNTTTGTFQIYLGGIWNDIGTSTPTPNATTTVAGKVQLSTQTQFNNGTATGSTSASLSATPDIIQLGIQNAAQISGTTTNIGNAYSLTLTPALPAYVVGQSFKIKINASNTGASTLNINSLGAITIKRDFNQDVNSGDLSTGQIFEVAYDGTNFQIIGGLKTVKLGSPVTKTQGTIYQAATDVFVFGYWQTQGAAGGTITAVSDTNATPTTVVAQFQSSAAGFGSPFSFPVQKNSYYKVNFSGQFQAFIFEMSLS